MQLDRKGVLKEGSAEEDLEERRGLAQDEGNGIAHWKQGRAGKK